jgi:calcineurin-like phosphoesterase family protein
MPRRRPRPPLPSRGIPVFLVLALVLGFTLARPAAVQPESVWTGVEKIVAIGDLHGGYDQFVRLLRGTDLIDSHLKWIGGKAHLVQMGDVMDRGDRAKDIFDLIRRLEKEAEAAGGRVHMLIGNHEELNLIRRSLQYADFVSQKQFFDFLPLGIRINEESRVGGRLSWNDWLDIIANEESVAKAYYDNFRDTYGYWIAEHNVVIQINDTVFVHGGLTESYAAMGIQAINDLYHGEIQPGLRGKDISRPRIVFQADGPLWNRRLADTDETAEHHATIDRILASLNAKRIVVAHTPTNFHGREEEMRRYDGKIWVIDTGISFPGGRVWAIVIENGAVSVHRGGGTP